jgi:hypothetical protein
MRNAPFAGAVALIASVALTACSDNADVVRIRPESTLFTSYVALGNSITAGLQSGGINDSTQRQSYAYLLAQQMGTRFAIPALAFPGCPPPIDIFPSHRLGNGTDSTCALREQTSVTTSLNNVAVPGATSFDPISPSTAASNALTTFILGGQTQVQRALEADPTFVSIWIGNNDVLAAAVSGVLTPLAGVSPGITPIAAFTSNYETMLGELTASPTLRGGILIGVVNVANAPVLFPARLLVISPEVKAAFDAAVGTTTTVHPSCTATTTSLISLAIVSQIVSGAHPPLIVCEKNQPGVPAPVGDIFVLDGPEQEEVAGTVSEYNAQIQAKAAQLGWAYYDPNAALVQLRAQGLIPIFPNLQDLTKPFGDYISLDGIHPAAAAHVLVANALITAINAQYNTSIPAIATR